MPRTHMSRRGLLFGGAALMAGGALAAPLLRAAAEHEPSSVNGVRSTPVEFRSEGALVRGNLFGPSTGHPIAAVVFSGPMTSVKEQSAGVYASALAQRGFAALAFDHRFFGASEGSPRQLEDPEAKVADIRNAVTAMSEFPETRTLPVVTMGLCIGSAYMARAVADDDRIVAFASVAGAFVSPERIRKAMGQKFDELLQRSTDAQSRWQATGDAEIIPAVGSPGSDVAMPSPEAFEYYGTSRAGRAYVNGFAVQSWAHTLPFDSQGAAASISAPTLIVHSANATFPEEASRFAANVAGDKSEVWLTSQGQVDFYDSPDLIGRSADAAAGHFRAAVG